MFTAYSQYDFVMFAADGGTRTRIKKGANRFTSKAAVPAHVLKKLEFWSKQKTRKGGVPIVTFEDDGAAAASDDADVELTAKGLAGLSFKDLVKLAGKLEVDVEGLRSKEQVTAKLLEVAAAASGDADVDDEDDESDDEDETTDQA